MGLFLLKEGLNNNNKNHMCSNLKNLAQNSPVLADGDMPVLMKTGGRGEEWVCSSSTVSFAAF